MEDIVKCYEIEEIGRVLLVSVGNILYHLVGNNLQLLAIIPKLIEE